MKYERELLCGRWFREDTQTPNKKIIEYAQINADGSFEFTFITLQVTVGAAEKIVEQVTELGDWGLVGDIHFTITKDEIVDELLYAADLNDGNNYHAYKVLQLNHHVFEYQHVETNETFIMRKVTDNIGHC
ncbi:hypothetical protein Q4506_04690 [Colwellia sp. 4_MG-2023]|uniref:hypothetical protein n=1 Tax=unclassified Colwellia TaxID=196834 RepID=UPI00209014DD|nr:MULTISPECIES: hypothetical protein [unclassified Colwellia]MDO6488067.1 hypothetical protein [Colwellia sp. 6_MG-2023]MDO6506477.1 hypothetical protein [Colwellia sp. 5_MG-2023]MDO6554964.1 hypothetical protein [Colwellia sp. 4_MG-2023]MDO6651857.1 hypothetical protein [Colwellia sp. 3_MG-2023]MDO6665232.1 hypothetical protein [Colwellia sp. 2_MG-2023]